MKSHPHTVDPYGPPISIESVAKRELRLFSSGDQNSSRPPIFGKRSAPPVRNISLMVERLLDLYAELTLVFEDLAYPEHELPFSYHEVDEPFVQIGASGCVQIDMETGSYVFSDKSVDAGSVLVTTSHDRLMDFIISHLARGKESVAPETRLSIVEKCVGQSIADLERALILATLRHCRGNRTHAAKTLGISLRTLRNKLRSYWRSRSLLSVDDVGTADGNGIG